MQSWWLFRFTNFQPYQFKTRPTHSHKTWFFTHKQRHKVSGNMRQKGRKSRQQNSDFPTSKVTKTHALKDVYVLRKYWNLKEKNNLQYSCFLDEDPQLLVAWGLAIPVALLALPPQTPPRFFLLPRLFPFIVGLPAVLLSLLSVPFLFLSAQPKPF